MIKKLLVLAAFALSLGLIGCAPPPGPQGGPGPGPMGGPAPQGMGPGGQYGGPGGPGGYPPIPNSEPRPNTIYTSPAP